MKCKENETLNKIFRVLLLISKSQMLDTVKLIYYDYLKSFLDKKPYDNELLEILFRFGYFEDLLYWISRAIDEKNIDFINILSREIGLPKIREQKSKIREMIYEKLDIFNQNGESNKLFQKINYILNELKRI